jgi:hypothetical protein
MIRSLRFIRVGFVLAMIVGRDGMGCAKCMSRFYHCADSFIQGYLNQRSSCLARTFLGMITRRVTTICQGKRRRSSGPCPEVSCAGPC